jgi:soluble P-type ATPase
MCLLYDCMKVLILVATAAEKGAINKLAKAAGLENYQIDCLYTTMEDKPKMTQLRKRKLALDMLVIGFDVVVASGETAARLAFDKPIVNITKLRGRDFEYKPGCRTSKKEKKND